MNKLDFTTEKVVFNNGSTKWYKEPHFTNYLKLQQAENLPKLKNLYCFVVIGKDISDLVLIDNKQNIFGSYAYTKEGYGQMEAKINILKIAKHYENNEL